MPFLKKIVPFFTIVLRWIGPCSRRYCYCFVCWTSSIRSGVQIQLAGIYLMGLNRLEERFHAFWNPEELILFVFYFLEEEGGGEVGGVGGHWLRPWKQHFDGSVVWLAFKLPGGWNKCRKRRLFSHAIAWVVWRYLSGSVFTAQCIENIRK